MPRHDITLTFNTGEGVRRVVLQLDPDQMSQRIMLDDLAAGRLYESETSNFVGAILRPGDTFIDIGAHVGYFTLLASALVGATGAVYCFEPEARNYAHLLDHLQVNQAWNVRPLHMAVGAEPGVADFHVNADNDGGHALWAVGNHPFNERTRQAPTVRRVFMTALDHLFAGHDLARLKAIKIDAEGAEHAILRGAAGLLARHALPFLILEINRFGLESMGTSERDVRGVMEALGYETYLFQPGQNALQRLAPNETPETNYVFNLLFRHPDAPAVA